MRVNEDIHKTKIIYFQHIYKLDYFKLLKLEPALLGHDFLCRGGLMAAPLAVSSYGMSLHRRLLAWHAYCTDINLPKNITLGLWSYFFESGAQHQNQSSCCSYGLAFL